MELILLYGLFINRVLELLKPGIRTLATRLPVDTDNTRFWLTKVLGAVVGVGALAIVNEVDTVNVRVFRDYIATLPEWADIVATGAGAGLGAEVFHEGLKLLRNFQVEVAGRQKWEVMAESIAETSGPQ